MMVRGKKLVRSGNHLRFPNVHWRFRQIKQRKTLGPATGRPLCLENYHGTLKGIFSIVHGKEQHTFSVGRMFHICYNLHWANGTMTDGCVPMELICPPFTWNITEALIQNVKKLLLEIESN